MKNIKIVSLGSLLGILLILNACYYDEVIPVEQSVGDVGNVAFSADIIPIFNASCNMTGCHSKGGQKPNLNPEGAYNNLTTASYIDTANPENSLLYQKMKGNKGTPMPVTGSVAIYNAKVLKWIELGALNN